MSIDPFVRIPEVFGDVIARKRRERNLTAEELATTSRRISSEEIRNLEAGNWIPTLRDFFYLAVGLQESPVILLSEVVSAWRTTDSTDYGLYKSRPSDLTRLYRLGCFHDPGDFRELPRVYGQMDQATGAARSLNAPRRAKSLPPLNTICIYLRVGSVAFRPDEEGES
jgi:hypothetical protein